MMESEFILYTSHDHKAVIGNWIKAMWLESGLTTLIENSSKLTRDQFCCCYVCENKLVSQIILHL